MSENNIQFPTSLEEARKRFNQYQTVDPLKQIPPALLNSGDIFDYARITGMIHPFAGNKEAKN